MRELEVAAKLTGHAWQCSSVHFHPAGNVVASASWDRTVRIWDVDEQTVLRVIDRTKGHQAPLTCVRWHPNGAMLATTSADQTTMLWDASTGERMRVLREHFGWVLSCSFAPDRTKLATASWDKTVRLWDPNTGELISTLRGHTKGVWACEFYPVGHTSALLATGGEDATARLWDTRSRKVALTLSGGHADAIYSVAWSNDGTLIATGSADKTVTIWDPKAGKVLRLLKAHEDTVKSMVFAPINQHNPNNVLASAGGNSSILWNPNATSRNLLTETRAHHPGKEVETVSISYNGRLLASGGRDGDVIIYRIPSLPKEGSSLDDEDSTSKPTRGGQSRVAETWINKHEKSNEPRPSIMLKKEMAAEIVRSAMEDESASWLKRSAAQQKQVEASKEGVSLVHRKKTDASKLLLERGFSKEGFVQAQPTAEEAEAAAKAETAAAQLAAQLASAASKATEMTEDVPDEEEGEQEDVRHAAPLRKVQMMDDAGKAHPMVAAARQQQEERQRPTANKISDVGSLMHMLREKTGDVDDGRQEQAMRPQPRPQRVEAPREHNASVSELLEMAKPKLSVRTRVRSVNLTPEES